MFEARYRKHRCLCWLGQDPHFIFKEFCSFVVVASLTFIQVFYAKHRCALGNTPQVAKHVGITQSPTGHPGTRAPRCALEISSALGQQRPPEATYPTNFQWPTGLRNGTKNTNADTSLHSGLTGARNHELNIQWQDWKVDVKVGPTPEPSPAQLSQLTLRMVSGFRDLKQVCGFST